MKKGVIGLIFSIFSIFISSLLLFVSINLNKKNLLLAYNVNNNITYNINATDSLFYDKNNINDSNSFPVDFINSIDVNFNNNISFNKETDLVSSYKVYAKIEVMDSNKDVNNIIYSKTDYLLEEQDIKSNSILQNTIAKQVNIDYKKYNDIVNKYKLKINMPVEARLKVVMETNNKSDILDKEEKLVFIVPLSVNTITITTDYNKNYNDNVYEEVNNRNAYIICSVLIIILSIFVLIFSIRNIHFNRKDYSLYKLNKILNYYEQIIVLVKNAPIIKKESILKIEYFQDMIDLNRELKQPILYYKSNDNDLGLFILISNDRTYIYEVDSKREKI